MQVLITLQFLKLRAILLLKAKLCIDLCNFLTQVFFEVITLMSM